MSKRRPSKKAAREARSRAALKGWATRERAARKRSRIARKAANARWAKHRAAADKRIAKLEKDRSRRATKRRELDRRLGDRPRVRIGRAIPKERRRGARSDAPGAYLPAPGSEVARAYEIRKALVNGGEEPDRVKVFYVVDGEPERRFSVASWDRFMSDETYEAVVEVLQEEGEFWIGLEGPDGDLEIPIERLA